MKTSASGCSPCFCPSGGFLKHIPSYQSLLLFHTTLCSHMENSVREHIIMITYTLTSSPKEGLQIISKGRGGTGREMGRAFVQYAHECVLRSLLLDSSVESIISWGCVPGGQTRFCVLIPFALDISSMAPLPLLSLLLGTLGGCHPAPTGHRALQRMLPQAESWKIWEFLAGLRAAGVDSSHFRAAEEGLGVLGALGELSSLLPALSLHSVQAGSSSLL